MKKEKNKESIIDLKKKLKEVEFTNVWSLESELKNGSIIDLKKKLKEVEFTNSWSPVDELENGDIESDDKTPTSVKLITKKDVFITIYEFSERTPKILDNIKEYLILNEENINYARMNKDDKGFYEHLKTNGYSYLKDNTDLLENLTQSQLIKVQNLILAVYLILKSDLKPHSVQKIADVTRWSTDLIRKHFNIYDLKKNFKKLTLREVETLSKSHPDSNLLINISKRILEDALAKPKKLTIDALPLGFKTNLKYLAASLIFYALNHTEYNRLHTKFKLYTVTEYINDIYPDNITWKLALTNVVPCLYDFISESIKLNISYFPIKGHEVSKEVREKVIKLREEMSSIKFIKSLKSYIKKYSKSLPDPQTMEKMAVRFLENAVSPPDVFSYDKIVAKNRWFSSPNFLAPCFLFLAFNRAGSKVRKSLNISEFSKKYFKSYRDALYSNVSFIYTYISRDLKEEIAYIPTQTTKKDLKEEIKENRSRMERIEESNGKSEKISIVPIHTKKRNFREIRKHLRNLFKLFNINDPEEYLKTAKGIYEIALQNGFDFTKIQKFKPKQLICFSVSLLYYSLLKKGHKSINKKEIWSKLKKTSYHVGQNSFSRISQDFGNYIDIKGFIKYDRQSFKEKLQEIKEQYEKNHRYDNVALIDLLLKTLDLYRSDFKDYINKIALIGSLKAKASKIIERLIIPNNFNKISVLNNFISKYETFIDKYIMNSNDKNELNYLLEKFRISKEEFYRFEEKKTEKKLREQERYSEYGDSFYSMENRIKRF